MVFRVNLSQRTIRGGLKSDYTVYDGPAEGRVPWTEAPSDGLLQEQMLEKRKDEAKLGRRGWLLPQLISPDDRAMIS